jgi:hypothetical protein
LAPLRHADEHQKCLLIGVDRKGLADGQSDAIDLISDIGGSAVAVTRYESPFLAYCVRFKLLDENIRRSKIS